ncbi:MAG: large protein [Cytophagaceae bacterium]|jgi:uncharacterized delta-60 repeat protein/gliding motility-associated-like protein|nr:large protein [Cytophagaceae bacterium]
MKKIFLTSFVLVFCTSLFRLYAQPGTLDLTFNGSGIQDRTFLKNLANEDIYDAILQPDGKIIVVGVQTLHKQEGFIARFLPSGQWDNSFGKNGLVLLSKIPAREFLPHAVALQANGKIVMAGPSYASEVGYTHATLVRLNSNGSIDLTYNGTGRQFFHPVTEANRQNHFNTVQIHDSTQTIVACGTHGKFANTGDLFIAATNPNGSILYTSYVKSTPTDYQQEATCSMISPTNADSMYIGVNNTGSDNKSSFSYMRIYMPNAGGLTSGITSFSKVSVNTNDLCTKIKSTSDGRILLVGTSYGNAAGGEGLVYRILPNGTVSPTAEMPSGYKTFAFNGPFTEFNAAFLDEEDNLIVGGQSSNEANFLYTWFTAKISSTGVVDPSYGVKNYTTTNVSFPVGKGVTSILPTSSGYLLVGENNSTGVNRDGLIKSINTSGNETSGIVNQTFWTSDGSSVVHDISVQNNGEAWVCGTSAGSISDTLSKGFVAKFNANGTLNAAIGNSLHTEPGVKSIVGATYGTTLNAIQVLPDGKVLVAGSTRASLANGKDFFIARLDANGNLDNSFNGGAGFFQYNFFGKDDEVADIALQGNKIVVYGYATRIIGANTYSQLAMIRLNEGGTLDETFCPSDSDHRFVYTNSDVSDVFFKMVVQEDGRIVGVGTDGLGGNLNFLVFRLKANGDPDPTFNTTGFYTTDFKNKSDYATCLWVKPDGTILAGGNAETATGNAKHFALIQLLPNGTLDTSFHDPSSGLPAGKIMVDAGHTIQGFSSISMENSTRIVGVGLSGSSLSNFKIVAVRLLANGVLDNTFAAGGIVELADGMPHQMQVSNGALYFVGQRMPTDLAPYAGVVAKVKLGVGIPTYVTSMVYSNRNKTYGDAPFLMKPVSNSPAPFTYKIVSGNCAQVNSSTNLITITCASPSNQVVIRAYQQAVPGYTSDSADATLTIAKASPLVQFKKQGTVIGETFGLEVITNAEATPFFSLINGGSYIAVTSNGQVTALAEGQGTVMVTFPASDNFLPAYAVADVYAYTAPIKPVAYDDEATLFLGVEQNIFIDIFANDIGFTGKIMPGLTDLNPDLPGIQSEYLSPAYGAFVLENDSVVRYTPFLGFIGSGEVLYTITDDRGSTSLPAKIKLTVRFPGQIPALKATELVTPNGDDLNDAFVIGFTDADKPNHLRVYDRNGGEVFNQTNYQNDWKGILSNGQPAEDGIYYYLFIEGSDGDSRELKGVVEIRRY